MQEEKLKARAEHGRTEREFFRAVKVENASAHARTKAAEMWKAASAAITAASTAKPTSGAALEAIEKAERAARRLREAAKRAWEIADQDVGASRSATEEARTKMIQNAASRAHAEQQARRAEAAS